VQDGVLRVTVDQEASFGDGVTATARIADPTLTDVGLQLERSGANTFEGEAPVTEPGTYAVGVTVQSPSGETLIGSTIATHSYAAEYEPGQPDEQALVAVSTATDGRGAIDAAEAFDVAGLAPGRTRIALAGWFLLAAALLWPVAVATSRLALRGTAAAAVRRRAAWVGWAGRSVLARMPARPGRERPAEVVKPPPKPEAPVSERAAAREQKVAATTAKQTATVGRLLERKRETRGDSDPDRDPDRP
jgi:hypothetical protein